MKTQKGGKLLSRNKIQIFFAGIAAILAVLTILWFEYLKKNDTENWNGTALYGIKSVPKSYRGPEKPSPTLEEMRDFAFGKKK